MKHPTPKEYFDHKAICPEIIADLAFDDAKKTAKMPLTTQDKEYFITQADSWVRYLHATNKKWKRILERETNDDRDFIIAFIRHWAAAFVLNPQTYKQRHPILTND